MKRISPETLHAAGGRCSAYKCDGVANFRSLTSEEVNVPSVTSLCMRVGRLQNLSHQRGKVQGLHAHAWWQCEGNPGIKKIVPLFRHTPRPSRITSKGSTLWQGPGRGPSRLIRLVRRVPPTTDGTRLKTAWSLTGALPECLTATAWSLTGALPECLTATAWSLTGALPECLTATAWSLTGAPPECLTATAWSLTGALPECLTATAWSLTGAPRSVLQPLLGA